MSDQFADVRAHFLAALERDELEAQLQYAVENCSHSPKLRADLEAMLRAHHQTVGFLASRVGPTHDSTASTEALGSRVGPYKLLQEIGQGGMGVVYMAEQLEPVRRKVAIKVIKPGMDSRQVIARFEVERQTLSLMDHPNIARILDAGTTDGGSPYFVMELVKGQALTTYCDENQLTPRQRLELLMPICQAIQHAHQKGIIHRDIKPSNILVAEYDGQPVPKVIDFGVAKAIGQPLTEKTLFTRYGQVVGTLEYMSPEQACFNQLDVDTRSDIYSLGVLLYELLTGSTPHDKQRLRSAAWDEMLRIIREEEPPRPSTRLSESKDALFALSAQRQTEPTRLAKIIRGELDWIVMKALEKERARRYESAGELASDLKRYLNDEAVQACPPKLDYRLRKYARRHRKLFVVAGMLLAVMVAGTCVSVWQAVRASRAEQLASKNAEKLQRERDAKANALQLALASEAAEQTALKNEQMARESEIAQRRAAEEAKAKAESNAYFHLVGRIQLELKQHDYAAAQRLFDSLPSESRPWEYRYLQLQLRARTQTLKHAGIINCVAFSPDGRRLASLSSTDQSLCLWDSITGQLLVRCAAPGLTGMSTMAFSADGSRFAVPGSDHTLRLHDASSGNELLVIKGCMGPVHGVAFSRDGKWIASASEGDPSIRLWEADTGKLKFAVSGQSWRVAFSPDSQWLAAGGPDQDVVVWDVATTKPVRMLQGFDRPLTGLTFSPDGKSLAGSSAFGRTAVVWNVASGAKRLSLNRHAGDVWDVAFSPDGALLATAGGGLERTVRIWDAASGREIHQFRAHSNRVTSIAFSPDGTRLASAGYDSSVRLWQLSEDPAAVTAQGPAAFLHAADFSPDRLSVVAIDGEGWVSVFKTLTGETLLRFRGHPVRGLAVSFSPDGSQIASGADDGVTKVWDSATGNELLTLPGAGGAIQSVAFSPDGKQIATASRDHHIRIWDSGTGRKLQTLPVVEDQSARGQAHLHVAFHPTEPRVVSIGPDRCTRIWDLKSGRELRRRTHPTTITDVAFSPDGARLAMIRADEILAVWNLSNDKLVDYPDHVRPESHVVFSPDGQRLVVACGDGSVKIRDSASGHEILALAGPSPAIRKFAFHPDGSSLSALSVESALKTWQVASEREPDDGAAAPKQDQATATGVQATAKKRSNVEPMERFTGDASDLNELQGTWRIVELHADGEPAPKEVTAKLKFVFKTRKLTITPGEPGYTNYRVEVDQAATPARFDLIHADGDNQGDVRKGIYRVEGGRLKICLSFSERRPREFSAEADSGQAMYVLERENP